MTMTLSADELLTPAAFTTAEHLVDALRRFAQQHGLPVRSGVEDYEAQVRAGALLLQLLVAEPGEWPDSGGAGIPPFRGDA